MYNVKAVKLMLIEKQTFIEFQKNIIYLRFLKIGFKKYKNKIDMVNLFLRKFW